MLISPATLSKTRWMADTYTAYIFAEVSDIPVRMEETDRHLRAVPGGWRRWPLATRGATWGKPGGSAWFAGELTIPDELDGQTLYIRAAVDGHETLFWVDGRPRGIFTHPREAKSRGNHHTLLLTANATAGQRHEIALEAYAGHRLVGTQPFDTPETQGHYAQRWPRVFDHVRLATRRTDVKDFVCDLTAVSQLAGSPSVDDFRRAKLCAALEDLFALVPRHPADHEEQEWRTRLGEGRRLLQAVLAKRNSGSVPRAGLVGHSHIDTAWTWTIDETIRKCARTWSNVLSLMDQYPEYIFIQSSPYHAEMMRTEYPDIFRGIQARVPEGRWEPVGGTWIECDCNLTGGEALVRQFLRGIRHTKEHFDYTPDVFWLPDTFGYSAALPQILQQCGLSRFLTTKLSWNDTNTFPYDTFRWRGLDRSEVVVHFNETQCWPDPATLIGTLYGGKQDFRTTENFVRHKEVNDCRLVSYGFGDGGGGPHYEMLEMARRCADTEGCPRAGHTTVSRFMRELEQNARNMPVYTGELYFEGHRGTLTQMHAIKKGNRKGELMLRDLECIRVLCDSGGGGGDGNDINDINDAGEEIAALWDLLLVNQFHDILPGTSIPEVHDRAISELAQVQERAAAATRRLTGTPAAATGAFTLWNTLGWRRSGPFSIPWTLPPPPLPAPPPLRR
ncbi:MAG: hypothetical protein LBK99_15335 [Opitutaceae bacterium]|nr:hypothetical protein [Opitutaceae bacterium]